LARSKTGQAISEFRRTGEQLAALDALLEEAKARGDLDEWRRARGVRRYIDGKKVTVILEELGVSRSTVNTWLRWYETMGADGLRTWKAPGAVPRLSPVQKEELTMLIEAGPQAAGFTSGLWTGPMIGQLIRDRFGVNYHNHHVPRLLHQLGFSVQRPRKRLARADADAQATWLRERLPAIKKKPEPAGA
jgi:transposase